MPFYPSTPATFPTRLDGQVIFAAHMNAVQDEVVSLTQGLLNGLGHGLKPLLNDTYDLGTLTRKWRDVHVSRDVFIAGNLTVGGTVSFPTGVVQWSDIDFTGSALSDLADESASATNLTSGTVPDARFPSTLPALNGSLLTALNATQLTTGTVADARLSANVPLLDAANQFSNTNRFTNTGLTILDTNASHVLTIKPGSDITANKVLTLTTGDSDRTITLSGNPTLDDWFDQSVKVAASPTFVGLTLSGLGGTNHVVKAAAGGALSSGTIAASFLSDYTATTFTTTWTGSITNPVLNNGTSQGYYIQIGKMVFFTIYILMGSSTTFGSGTWSFTLPVTANTTPQTVGACQIFDSSAPFFFNAYWRIDSSTTLSLMSAGAQVTPTVPMTWAQSDYVMISGCYPAA